MITIFQVKVSESESVTLVMYEIGWYQNYDSTINWTTYIMLAYFSQVYCYGSGTTSFGGWKAQQKQVEFNPLTLGPF